MDDVQMELLQRLECWWRCGEEDASDMAWALAAAASRCGSMSIELKEQRCHACRAGGIHAEVEYRGEPHAYSVSETEVRLSCRSCGWTLPVDTPHKGLRQIWGAVLHGWATDIGGLTEPPFAAEVNEAIAAVSDAISALSRLTERRWAEAYARRHHRTKASFGAP